MGAADNSTREKALSGTLVAPKVAEDAATPAKAFEELTELAPDEPVAEVAAAALVGPRDRFVDEVPPETKPALPVDPPGRMYKSRRSRGFFWNPGISSNTT